MKQAALNTVLGMSTVFIVLIFISVIISLLSHIDKITKFFTGVRKRKETVVNAIDNTLAQIEEKEARSDDTELAAVITAAIAAGTGVSVDSFTVRSIKRCR